MNKPIRVPYKAINFIKTARIVFVKAEAVMKRALERIFNVKRRSKCM